MNNTLSRLNFNQSKRAKNVGFDWPTEYHYSHWNSPATDGPGVLKNWNALAYECWGKKMPLTSAPEIALFLQWARTEKGIYGFVMPEMDEDLPTFYIQYGPWTSQGTWSMSGDFDSYPAAESALVDEILNIL